MCGRVKKELTQRGYRLRRAKDSVYVGGEAFGFLDITENTVTSGERGLRVNHLPEERPSLGD